ncbi:conserved exported hypothetical protein [Frankia canadensis]|uniref:Uncharacterized protein n=1 Tax=Frankia canadensis TaxID=1836972 RepID=A0A2I2KM92_9ACTN|nr:hypothetical protein [Frankia canadensis]SNQ46766.1 conserved exported hypothetical protein [Frankia canadensis]SOU54056.1 conserved exported hypothetical protein [Frankia canadensis]
MSTPGPLAVEAALLLDALRGLATAAAADPAAASAASAANPASAADPAGGPDPAGVAADPAAADSATRAARGCAGEERPCTSCPLCRLMAALSADRSEVMRHLVAAGESLVAAFRAAVEAATVEVPQGRGPRPPGAPGPRTTPAPRPRVQRIDVT